MTLRPEPYERWQNDATYGSVKSLERTALGRGLSLSTLALARVLTDPAVNGAVIGPRRPEQVAQAVAALDVTLTDDEWAALAVHASGSP
jgi:aryl-alcohol dehydrogenase-like predicted oxidoreductase